MRLKSPLRDADTDARNKNTQTHISKDDDDESACNLKKGFCNSCERCPRNESGNLFCVLRPL